MFHDWKQNKYLHSLKGHYSNNVAASQIAFVNFKNYFTSSGNSLARAVQLCTETPTSAFVISVLLDELG